MKSQVQGLTATKEQKSHYLIYSLIYSLTYSEYTITRKYVCLNIMKKEDQGDIF